MLGAAEDAKFVNTQYRSGEPATSNVVDNPSISSISKEWTLNEDQHAAFTLLSCAILDRIVCRLDEPQDRIAHAQEVLRSMFNQYKSSREFLPKGASSTSSLRMYLAGCGGTGKSRVIKALSCFAERWGGKDVVVKTATTGVAATLLGASTYFSALNVSAAIKKQSVSESVRVSAHH